MEVIIAVTFVVIGSFLFGYYAGKEAEKSSRETIKSQTEET